MDFNIRVIGNSENIIEIKKTRCRKAFIWNGELFVSHKNEDGIYIISHYISGFMAIKRSGKLKDAIKEAQDALSATFPSARVMRNNIKRNLIHKTGIIKYRINGAE